MSGRSLYSPGPYAPPKITAMVDERITVGQRRAHSKASEVYISVTFRYRAKTVQWDIPIEYRRTGTHLAESDEVDLASYLEDVYQKCDPSRWAVFRAEQEEFWSNRRSGVTKSFFDVLVADFSWKSISSDFPANPNFARRIQDLKEMGYTIATDTKRRDAKTGAPATHLLLIPLPRGGITGYETWTPLVRGRIIDLLRTRDAFEGKAGRKDALLPDHKFPEIRWDADTKRDDLSGLSDAEIERDFQLMTNQRNQQKREVCRACYQTGKRGTVLGIAYFYAGGPNWDPEISRRGKGAEEGCVGCAWYDLDAWRAALNSALQSGHGH